MNISELADALRIGHLSSNRLGIIIPTYNAADNWLALQVGIEKQGITASQVVVVDSSSTDDTRLLAQKAGYRVVRIRKEEFNHGATRQLACSYLPESEYLVFLTQDAILAAPDSIERLCEPFEDPAIGAVYGRQLPRPDADPIERHGRLFNYPDQSRVKGFDDRQELGFKTVFFSNSFAAYRRSALEAAGGFPADTIVSEEVTVVARMLAEGWKVSYQADALAIHSHPLNLRQEFSRYFDIGVHHGREKWLLETFGGTGNDGVRYVKSELRFLSDYAPLWLPYAALRHVTKYVAYKLGTLERVLPTPVSKRLSDHPGFWERNEKQQMSSAVVTPSPGREVRDSDLSASLSTEPHPRKSVGK